ncbi:MAG: TonB-dependent receptor [bacterium]
MSKKIVSFFALLALGLLFSSPILCQEESKEGSNSGILVVLPEPEWKEGKDLGAASSELIPETQLDLVPIERTGDLLEVVPGLVAIQHAGGGKANQYYLRGFDADHGTDIAFSQDQVPINMVSHAHGQGYSDLNFIIPELVEAIEVRKGPYSALDGDFATAGAINFSLKERMEGNSVSFQAGRFNTYRGLLTLGKDNGSNGLYAAAEGYYNDGPFDHPNRYERLNLVVRGFFETEHWKGVFTGSTHDGRWNASNQIPVSLVESGQLSRFGAIDPSDGGRSHRHQLYGTLTWTPDEKQKLSLLLYGFQYDLNLFSNFTFFLNDPVNGDQIEQKDNRQVFGYRADYSREDRAGKITFKTAAGSVLRFDHIHNELNHTVGRNLLSQETDNHIDQLNPSLYAQEEILFTDWFKLVAGGRLDLLQFHVTDLLGKGVEGNKTAFIFSPKLSLIFSPRKEVDVFLNFGQGFHSNDARGVFNTTTHADPDAKATGGELGVETRLFNRWDFSVSGWALKLNSEQVFVGDEGTTEPSGATVRAGAEIDTRLKILDWLWADFNFAYTHAEFLDEPANNNAVPLAPRFTLSGGLSAQHPSGFYGSARVRAISSRPANQDRSLTATGYMVWDLMAGYKKTDYHWLWNKNAGFGFQLDVLNLFNANYRESQFDTTSRPTQGGPVITDVHFTPGTPITILGTASLYF